ncbi:MAG: hypothetical protein IH987_19135 [Planctomycetes bacterium]|nr:hypothetical protein [Planctomycetota bacterium]
MTATDLYKISVEALTITGYPEWCSMDVADERDKLIFLDDEASEDGPLWALAPTGVQDEDYLPIDTAMAHELIKCHLRNCLLERSWQIQVSVKNSAPRWRLVDCLSIADGGGDRTDQDYPYGHDELAVLCESVVVLSAG